LKTTELGENANSKTAMIFLEDHDKFFLNFHVQLTHHAAGKKAEATTRDFTVKFHGHLWHYKQRGKKTERGGKNTAPSKICLL